MANVNLPSTNFPLSGAVTQTFFPWTNFFTVNLGQSSDPDTETAALSVASYGKQLGRIGEALAVLLRHLPPNANLDKDEQRAINDLKAMLEEIADVKQRHGAPFVIRPSQSPHGTSSRRQKPT
jgi:hypothetical protein